MKRIGLISDTHGFIDPKVATYFEACDEIWHAGDFGHVGVSDQLEAIAPVRGVYGNIDGSDVRVKHPEHEIFTVEGLKVWMTHIGGYPGRYNPKIREAIKKERPGLFISGHSHILKIMPDKSIPGLLHINPGAAGMHGFHKVKTLVRFNVCDGVISDLEVIELGPRTK